MTATTAPYRSRLPEGREGFWQLLHAEWTKFRTVRGWVISAVAAALLIIVFAYLGTFRHQDGGICVGANPAAGTCGSFTHPTPPLGPGGEAVTDTYYFVHRTLTGDGSITARVVSLSGLIQTGSVNAVSATNLVGAPDVVQPWAKAGLIVNASLRPGSAYAAVMLTGAHGVRMQSDYTHDTGRPRASAGSPRWLRLTRSGRTLTGYESADGTHWNAVGSAHLQGLPASLQGGLFVASPQTSPPQHFLTGAGGVTGEATGATARFDGLALHGQWPVGNWTGREIGANRGLPTLTSVGSHRSHGGFTITGSGDIAPDVSSGYSDQPSLTGVFVGLLLLIVLATMFITAEYRRGLIHTTFAASPRRGRVLLAKALVIAAVTFVAGAAATAVSIPLGTHLLRSNGNYVYPIGTLTELRVVLGTGAVLALAAVLAIALATAVRRSAAAVTAVIVLIVLPYMLVVAGAVPTGAAQWLMRLTPAAAFAVEQNLPQYHQVNYAYSPSAGFYPLAPAAGFAVLLAFTVIALGLAGYRLRSRDA